MAASCEGKSILATATTDQVGLAVAAGPPGMFTITLAADGSDLALGLCVLVFVLLCKILVHVQMAPARPLLTWSAIAPEEVCQSNRP